MTKSRLARRPRHEVARAGGTGPGGVGKTRLATKAAASLADDLLDGVVFVPLTAIRDPDLVIPTIAQAFGIQETGDQLREGVPDVGAP